MSKDKTHVPICEQQAKGGAAGKPKLDTEPVCNCRPYCSCHCKSHGCGCPCGCNCFCICHCRCPTCHCQGCVCQSQIGHPCHCKCHCRCMCFCSGMERSMKFELKRKCRICHCEPVPKYASTSPAPLLNNAVITSAPASTNSGNTATSTPHTYQIPVAPSMPSQPPSTTSNTPSEAGKENSNTPSEVGKEEEG